MRPMRYQVLFLSLVFTAVFLAFGGAHAAPLIVGQDPTPAQFQGILGSWARSCTNAGQRDPRCYVLTVHSVDSTGNAQVEYENLRSSDTGNIRGNINVSEARVEVGSDGYVHLVVELDDIDYPKSRYNLKQYFPESSTLSGTYFHALSGRTFYVNFSRN